MEVDITIMKRFSDFLGRLIGKNRGFTDHKAQKYLLKNVRSDLGYIMKNFATTSDSGSPYFIKIPGLGEIQMEQINNDIENIRNAWRTPFRLFIIQLLLVIGLSFILAVAVSLLIYFITFSLLAALSISLILLSSTALSGFYYLGYRTKEGLFKKSPESFKRVSQLFYYL
ncbi:MAG: hypothetical protein ACFFDF_18605, partial [Candidatus Odinarchaeota archaeon]